MLVLEQIVRITTHLLQQPFLFPASLENSAQKDLNALSFTQQKTLDLLPSLPKNHPTHLAK
jgi:hypothetical protein